MDMAGPGQVWIADRHFCTQAIMQGFSRTGAAFIVREHTHHPRLAEQSRWGGWADIETGQVREQNIKVPVSDGMPNEWLNWRRIEIELSQPTESGEHLIRLWSNLPTNIEATTIARLYRKRRRIEGMFQRLESVLHSEIGSLGHPKAALLGFTVAVLAYNVLSLLQRCVEQAHRAQSPTLEVSTYHLAQHVKSGYEGMLIALPSEHWPRWADDDPQGLAQRLLTLARRIPPRQVATSKRSPKIDTPKGYVAGSIARSHISTARLLKAPAGRP